MSNFAHWQNVNPFLLIFFFLLNLTTVLANPLSENSRCQEQFIGRTLSEIADEVASRGMTLGFDRETSRAILDSNEHQLEFINYIKLLNWIEQNEATLETIAQGNNGQNIIGARLSTEGKTLLEDALRYINQQPFPTPKFRQIFYDRFMKVLAHERKALSNPPNDPNDRFLKDDLVAILSQIKMSKIDPNSLNTLINKYRLSIGKGGKEYKRIIERAVLAQLRPNLTGTDLKQKLITFLYDRAGRKFRDFKQFRRHEIPFSSPILMCSEDDQNNNFNSITSELVQKYALTRSCGKQIREVLKKLQPDEIKSVERIISRLFSVEPIQNLMPIHVVQTSEGEIYEIRPLGGNSPYRIFFALQQDRLPIFISAGHVKSGRATQSRLITDAARTLQDFAGRE